MASIDPPPLKRGPPKLRSSCDSCGAAKLKCDRGQPECERCVSYGMTCVYGLSRKMGKPPRRDTLRPGHGPGNGNAMGNYSNAVELNSPHNPSGSCGSISDLGHSSNGPNSSSATCESTDHNSHGLAIPFDALNGLFGAGDVSASSLPNFHSLDFRGWDVADYAHDSRLSTHLGIGSASTASGGLPLFESYSCAGTPTAQAMPHPSEADNKLSPSDTTSMSMSPMNITGHNCSLEAYEILMCLSALHLGSAQCASFWGGAASASTASGTGGVAGPVPLDHVLDLNRKASDRLGKLLACSCARLPHHRLLYASLISRILDRYQQAAGCTTSNVPWSSSSHPSTSTMTVGEPSSSSHLVSSVTGSEGGSSSGPGPAVAPVKMAIGSFDVDDLRVQAALKMQLLSGELRRAGRLLDQLSALSSGGSSLSDVVPHDGSGDTSSLYQGLDSWLRSEHARITNMMRSKLRELNT